MPCYAIPCHAMPCQTTMAVVNMGVFKIHTEKLDHLLDSRAQGVRVLQRPPPSSLPIAVCPRLAMSHKLDHWSKLDLIWSIG